MSRKTTFALIGERSSAISRSCWPFSLRENKQKHKGWPLNNRRKNSRKKGTAFVCAGVLHTKRQGERSAARNLEPPLWSCHLCKQRRLIPIKPITKVIVRFRKKNRHQLNSDQRITSHLFPHKKWTKEKISKRESEFAWSTDTCTENWASSIFNWLRGSFDQVRKLACSLPKENVSRSVTIFTDNFPIWLVPFGVFSAFLFWRIRDGRNFSLSETWLCLADIFPPQWSGWHWEMPKWTTVCFCYLLWAPTWGWTEIWRRCPDSRAGCPRSSTARTCVWNPCRPRIPTHLEPLLSYHFHCKQKFKKLREEPVQMKFFLVWYILYLLLDVL